MFDSTTQDKNNKHTWQEKSFMRVHGTQPAEGGQKSQGGRWRKPDEFWPEVRRWAYRCLFFRGENAVRILPSWKKRNRAGHEKSDQH